MAGLFREVETSGCRGYSYDCDADLGSSTVGRSVAVLALQHRGYEEKSPLHAMERVVRTRLVLYRRRALYSYHQFFFRLFLPGSTSK